jgi:hypothetical protein
MPYQVDDALRHAMSGTELSRVRTELRLLPPEPNNQRLLTSRGADIVMQSSRITRKHLSGDLKWMSLLCPEGEMEVRR